MILIFSNDTALAENLCEMLQMDGAEKVVIREGHSISEEDLQKGIELIIYHNRWDPTGEQFEWYLLANRLTNIPTIFLTIKERENKIANHRHLELPFDLNELESCISGSLAINRS